MINLLLSQTAPAGKTLWMPEQASTAAPGVDWLFYFIYYISLFFFVLIAGLMFVFIVRYRRRKPGEEAHSQVSHNSALEFWWSFIPTVIVVFMFWWGFDAFMNMRTPPEGAYQVNVTAYKWNWQFFYPNGIDHNELHVPVNTPVRLIMRSEDVIHSCYIPAFRAKRDVVPGRYSELWFEAVKPGTYPLFCAEYCGTDHSNMRTVVVVHESGEFEKWLETADPLKKLTPEQYDEYKQDPDAFIQKLADADDAELNELATRLQPLWQVGEKLYTKKGCVTCHSVDGSPGRQGNAPSFLGMFDREHVFADGTRLEDYDYPNVESYVRESILDPAKRIVAGSENIMAKISVDDREIDALIAYMKSLGGGEE